MNTIIGIRTKKKPVYYELISPEVAKTILQNNSGNRNISNAKLMEYYNQMIQGKYKEGTAEPLKISNKGRLLDGQHRLTALIKANMTIEFLVARDLDESIFDVLDTGKSRGAADVLSMANVPNSTTISSILKLFYNTKNQNNERYKLTNPEVLELYKKNEQKHDEIAVLSIRLYKSGKLFNVSLIGGLLLLFMEKNEHEAKSFFEQLCRVKPVQNNTVEVLYQLFVKDALSKSKIPVHIKIKIIIKAWNAFRAGKELKIIKYIESEGFPIVM
ncbi:conserved hypothetical protein [Flavobacterium psychrophilum]|uniref:hypothetical protein n=1 Tax=Flavobacterium psychrophilum TaxID=96345 RepID=UPI000B7C4972|nr:hypothetical protein [Flavobacterium psychrophilum]SNB07231.1 conserved hypothetical protein [Flavobacterium psychrophilum]